MDKYEYRVKTEQMVGHLENKQYKKAMEIADTIDWRRVKNAVMLNTVSEIYEINGEFQKSRDILFIAFDRSPSSRKIVYRLGTLAIKINDLGEASECYEEFVKLAPRDPNQYILKYKILRAQKAPISEQIAALVDFKKAEYVEKWAYELAKLYHEAGMTAECLEECDDLILWFSEGKYVFQAMELKMKYKPLTPLQREKYENYAEKKGIRINRAATTASPVLKKEEQVVKPAEKPIVKEAAEPEKAFEEEVEREPEEVDAEDVPDIHEEPEEIPAGATRRILAGEVEEALASMEAGNEEEVDLQEEMEEPVVQQRVKKAPIKTIITGATLEEALVNGVAMASGINLDEQKKMAKREEEMRIAGQMKIEDILLEWEEKQKSNAEAIAQQKAKDEERLRREREEMEARKAAEKKAAEEKEAEEVASRKAEVAARKAAMEKAAANKGIMRPKKAPVLSDDIRQLVEELEGRISDEDEFDIEEELELAQSNEGEEDDGYEMEINFIGDEEDSEEGSVEEELEGELEEEPAEEELEEEPEEELAEEPVEAVIEEVSVEEVVEEVVEEASVEEAEEEVAEEELSEDDFEEEELDEDDFEEEELEEDDFEEEELEEDDFEEEELDEDDFEEEELDEDDFEEEEPEEDDFEEEELDDNLDEDDVEFDDDFDEDDFDDDFHDSDFDDEFDDDEFDDDEFDDDEFDDDDFDEDDFEDEFDDDDFDEDDFEEDDFEEDDFEEDDFDEEDFGGEDFFEDDDELPEIAEPDISEPLELEEPSEEEIQKRIKKSKGSGVPFDTGFVVTGRYDLSATSEIGLKAGLTEEQKKLFSYFVPVRGMSEQIVEVLDNDRRAQREGTSCTGNLLVIGRKGSGKTVLAVDIVKAIQKQRNLKQGKVAIVTGESLNKKELSNIIHKLKGGAIIIEKAGKLNSRTINELNYLMEKKTGEMLFVLEDQRKPLERILTVNPEFKRKFTSRLELPVFINDELVTFGQTYAKENGYKLDEMGILALYSRIDVMQREDHAVTVAEVKEIMDEAIAHSQKANVKHLARRMFGKGTDDSDRIILKEDDFKI